MSNLLETLGITSQTVTKSNVIISLPVTDSIKQPYGIVHGGINAILAETAASLGANANLDEVHAAVGVDIATHHLAAVAEGTIVATATPVKIGRQLQVWEVTTAVADSVTSFSTVTLMAQPK
ncbi:PaaI family thioesterase [Secundilactobacillus kimchicus]|uniref:PaaI family thioesterase n=1 Tax=Secundilactobacillus kimchicus TaxID=528209 RepID=UPI0024A9B896|nr:PaaI family thioesterase [Secundilactobacillus kimchicus]